MNSRLEKKRSGKYSKRDKTSPPSKCQKNNLFNYFTSPSNKSEFRIKSTNNANHSPDETSSPTKSPHNPVARRNKKRRVNNRQTTYTMNDYVNSIKENIPKMSEKSSSSSRKKKRVSESFITYGMCLPTFESILKEQNEYKRYKSSLENAPPFRDWGEIDKITAMKKLLPEKILTCAHLSKQEIKTAFRSNYQYIMDIMNRVQHCERHEIFLKENFKDLFTTQDLRINLAAVAFTSEHKQYLIKLLDKHYSFDEDQERRQYCFKVLLPELCIKIFMDFHGMNHEEATDYLRKVPLSHLESALHNKM